MSDRFPDSFLDELRARLPVSEIVQRKMALKRVGSEFRAVDDKSLTVNDDKRLWWDHGGAGQEGGDIFDWLMTREGFSFPDAVKECAGLAGMTLPNGHAGATRKANGVRPEEPPPWEPDDGQAASAAQDDGAAGPSKREITKTYPYIDRSGALLYEVCRLEWVEDGERKKTFLQRRPAEDGNWVWGLGAGKYVRSRDGDWYQDTKKRAEWKGERRRFDQVEHCLYRVPELLDEIQEGRTVYLPEGEKDADTLWEWGFPASTNSGGAKNWRPELHAEVFRGADVVVIADNDDAGRQAAAAKAKSLHGIARRVRVLEWQDAWPRAPRGTDVTDWRDQAGGTPDRLCEIVDRLPAWAPEPYRSKWGGYRWEEIGQNADQYQWVVEDIIPAGEAVLFFGESGSGKSFDALDMALCVSRGLQFNGYNVDPGLVIYIAAEAGKGFAKRKTAYVLKNGLRRDERLPFYLLTKRPDFFAADTDADSVIEEIKAIQETYSVPLRMVFLDTLSAITPGMNENASQDVSKVKARIDRIRIAVNAAVILVHHKPKGGSTPRGHGSLTGDYETTVEFSTTEETDDERRKIHAATVVKQREGKSGIAWRFTLPAVEVGKNKWGNPETSCVVEPCEVQRKGGPAKVTPQQRRFLQALFEALSSYGEAPPPSMNLPRSVAQVVDYRHVKTIFAKRELDDGEDPKEHADKLRQALARARKDLTSHRIIATESPYIWWAGRAVEGFSVTSRDKTGDEPHGTEPIDEFEG